MWQFRSKLTVAHSKSPSLKTSIPEAVVQIMDSNASNEFVWSAKPTSKGVKVSITRGSLIRISTLL